jgi:hypothetical protein
MSAVADVRAWEEAPLRAVQGTLALGGAVLSAAPVQPVAPPTSALRGADAVVVAARTRRELERWALSFGQACVEIVLGDRPSSQLVRWTSPAVYRELAYRARVVAQATVRRSGGQGRTAVRPQVRQVRVCFVEAGVAEVALTVQYGARHRALAARFELVCEPGAERSARHPAGHWRCTALEFG